MLLRVTRPIRSDDGRQLGLTVGFRGELTIYTVSPPPHFFVSEVWLLRFLQKVGLFSRRTKITVRRSYSLFVHSHGPACSELPNRFFRWNLLLHVVRTRPRTSTQTKFGDTGGCATFFRRHLSNNNDLTPVVTGRHRHGRPCRPGGSRKRSHTWPFDWKIFEALRGARLLLYLLVPF